MDRIQDIILRCVALPAMVALSSFYAFGRTVCLSESEGFTLRGGDAGELRREIAGVEAHEDVALADSTDFVLRVWGSVTASTGGSPEWGVEMACAGSDMRVMIASRSSEDALGEVRFRHELRAESEGKVIAIVPVGEKLLRSGKRFLMQISRCGDDWRAEIKGGGRSQDLRFYDKTAGDVEGVAIVASPGTSVEVEAARGIIGEHKGREHQEIARLRELISASTAELAGEWEVYDYDIDPELLRLEPRMRLLLTEREGGGYDIHYLLGYAAGCGWEPGMKKGVLMPTSFPGIYDVEWTDMMQKGMRRGIRATDELNGVIKVQLPAQNSWFRLRRLDM